MDNCWPKKPTTFVTFSLLLISILVLYTFSSSSSSSCRRSFILAFWFFGSSVGHLLFRPSRRIFWDDCVVYIRHFGLFFFFFSRCASALISTSAEKPMENETNKLSAGSSRGGTTIFPVRHLFPPPHHTAGALLPPILPNRSSIQFGPSQFLRRHEKLIKQLHSSKCICSVDADV